MATMQQIPRWTMVTRLAAGVNIGRREAECRCRVVVILTSSGSARTAVGRLVLDRCTGRSAWVDASGLCQVRPEQIDQEQLTLLSANVRDCLVNLRNWGISNLIVTADAGNGIAEAILPVLGEICRNLIVYEFTALSGSVHRSVLNGSVASITGGAGSVVLSPKVAEDMTLCAEAIADQICTLEALDLAQGEALSTGFRGVATATLLRQRWSSTPYHDEARSATKLVLITGAPGVGKTTVGRLLFAKCPEGAAWLDIDALLQIRPWQVDEFLFSLAGANIRSCIANYRAWGAQLILVTGVMIPGGIHDELQQLLVAEGINASIYSLWADPAVLVERIQEDPRSHGTTRLLEVGLNAAVRRIPGCAVIDTTALSPQEVANRIFELGDFDK